jgi:hypothetical protein
MALTARPSTIARRSPSRGTITRTSPPCPTTNITPTAASDKPVSAGPQWKRYPVNNTQVISATRFANVASTKITMSPSTDVQRPTSRSAPTGFACAKFTALRFSTESDSGSAK